MSAARRLKHALLATCLVVQTVPANVAHASSYMRLQGSGYGAGLGGGAGTTDTTGTNGTNGSTDASGGTGGGSGGTTGGGNVVTGNPVTPGQITVTQNTDKSVTTTTQGTDGTVTKVTKQPDGTTNTIVTSPAGGTTQTVTTPVAGGGNVTTTAPVTSGVVDATGNVTAHTTQRFRAQFTTTSTGTPVWQAVSTVPAGVALSTVTGTLTGAIPDIGTYPVQVTDGIVAKPYSVSLNVIPPLDVTGGPLLLRKGTYASAGFWAQNAVGQSGETLAPLPAGLAFEPWGYLHGTPTDTGFSASSVSVTAQDSGDTGPTGTVTKAFPVAYYPQPLTIADYPDLTVTAGAPISVAAPVTGGSPVNPVFTVQGNLPGGLSFDRSTGAIAGTPTSIPTVTQLVTVTMTDDTGASVTTDPFRVSPVVTGTGLASSEYPVLVTDQYGRHPLPVGPYYSRQGSAPYDFLPEGVTYTYARPVMADTTLDTVGMKNSSVYKFLYNASTTGGTDWQPVTGPVLASQFWVILNDWAPTEVRIGYMGTYPGWQPYLPAPVTVASAQGTAASFDLAAIMPPTGRHRAVHLPRQRHPCRRHVRRQPQYLGGAFGRGQRPPAGARRRRGRARIPATATHHPGPVEHDRRAGLSRRDDRLEQRPGHLQRLRHRHLLLEPDGRHPQHVQDHLHLRPAGLRRPDTGRRRDLRPGRPRPLL